MAQFIIEPGNYLNLHLTGPPGNSTMSMSLGGTMSSVLIGSNQLLDDVTYSERTSGKVIYRGIYFANTIGNDTTETIPGEYTLRDVKMWIKNSTSGPNDEIYLAADTIGKKTGSMTMSSISSEENTPTITGGWSSSLQTISLGDFATNTGQGFWIKRSVSSGAQSWKNSSASIMISAEVISGVELV